MITNDDFQKAVDLINKSSSVLITTHAKPDGDACGSIVAISEILTTLGKNVKPILLSDMPDWYEFLFTEKAPILGEDISAEQLQQGQLIAPDLIIIIDTNSYSQLPSFDQYLKQNKTPVLIIDHHVTNDGLGDVELVDDTAAAAGLIVLDLLKFANWQITQKIARALFVSVATDTGWFQFSNTDSRVYRSCAELIDAGVDPARVYHDLYQNVSIARFKIMVAMLSTIELHLDGRFATQHLLQKDFQQAGAAYKDTENLIDQCRQIGSVEAAALFVELPDGQFRCSLRSTDNIDVRKIAEKLGGGGHKMAAGTHLDGPLKNAKQLIFEHIQEQFNQIDGKNT